MTRLNRRHFLTSLAATGAYGTIVPALGSASTGVGHVDRTGGEFSDWWFMARKWYPSCAAASLAVARALSVDFWSMPCSDINHAGYLPPEIQTGVLWYDFFAGKNLERCKSLDQLHYDYFADRNSKFCKALDQFRKERHFNRVDATSSVHIHTDGTDKLSSFLKRLQDERSRSQGSRTALIALDSLGPSPREPTWGSILPAFAQCYDHIIGLIHAPRRGLRDWKTFLNAACEEDFFEQSVWSSASQCDVVIVTSAGLVETDTGLCPRAATEALIGELFRRLGYALLDRNLHNQITCGTKRKPRLFALASVSSPPGNYYVNLPRIVERQRELVSGSFGNLPVDESPLFIATSKYDVEWPWPKAFGNILSGSGTSTGPEICFTVRAPPYQFAESGGVNSGALDLITLWPFNFDGEAENLS